MELWMWGVVMFVVVCIGGYIYKCIKNRPKEDPGMISIRCGDRDFKPNAQCFVRER